MILGVSFAFRAEDSQSSSVTNPNDRDERSGPGRLILVGTPLGNVGDASMRLKQTIENVDVVAVEDTRRFWRMCHDLGATVHAQVVSFYEAVEMARTPQLTEYLQGGSDVALLTDAGMPSVSDPGYRLVQACAEVGLDVTVVPGPSAAIAALAVSGLPSDRFCFEGFLARKPGERNRQLTKLQDEPRTMVFFESPRRVGTTLADMSEVFGADREAVVCRELTKTYEEVKRGLLGELAEWAAEGLLGEITIVVRGAVPNLETPSQETLASQVAELVASGTDHKEALSLVAKSTGVPKRLVYDAVLAAKNSNP